MRERWKEMKDIKAKTWVSNRGRIKKIVNGETRISYGCNKDGYFVTRINSKLRRVHRLVAKYFLPNPHNYKEVDHRDRNKKNNKVENLRWFNRSLNMQNTN